MSSIGEGVLPGSKGWNGMDELNWGWGFRLPSLSLSPVYFDEPGIAAMRKPRLRIPHKLLSHLARGAARADIVTANRPYPASGGPLAFLADRRPHLPALSFSAWPDNGNRSWKSATLAAIPRCVRSGFASSWTLDTYSRGSKIATQGRARARGKEIHALLSSRVTIQT